MENVFILALFFGSLAAVWAWLGGRMKRAGHNWFLRNIAGACLGFVVAILAIAVASSIGLISDQSQQGSSAEIAKEESPPLQVAAEPARKTLGMSQQQYAQRLGELLTSLNKGYRITKADVQSGAVNDSWKANVGPYVSVLASLSKSGEVLEVVAIGSGDGSPASGVDVLMLGAAAMTAATNNVEYREVLNGISAMIDGQVRSYGNVKLSIQTSKDFGNFFLATPL
jgi:hypothetical protein